MAFGNSRARNLRKQIEELDRKITDGEEAAKQDAEKKENRKTAHAKRPPLDPIDWSPEEIRLKMKIQMAELERVDRKAEAAKNAFNPNRFVEQMMTILAGGTRDHAWRATVNLAILEEYALPALQKGFAHDKKKVRYFCLRAVSLMKEGSVPLEAMQPLAQDADESVRCALARALGDRLAQLRKDKQMAEVRRILAALLNDRESVVRNAVASVLERARLETMAGPLLTALDRKEIGLAEQLRICSALESTFSFKVGVEYLPAPPLPADQDRRVQKWQEWGKQFMARDQSLNGGATTDAEGVD